MVLLSRYCCEAEMVDTGCHSLCLHDQSVLIKKGSQLPSSPAAASARAHRIRVLRDQVRCGRFVVHPDVIAGYLMRDQKMF